MPRAVVLIILASALLTGCAAVPPVGSPSTVAPASRPRSPESKNAGETPAPRQTDDDQDADDSEAALFRTLDETFGRTGEIKDGVYRLVTPRADLSVTVDR